MKSKDFEILINRLEKDNGLHRKKMVEIYNLDTKEMVARQEDLDFHKELIDYHETMIRYIKRLDKELYE